MCWQSDEDFEEFNKFIKTKKILINMTNDKKIIFKDVIEIVDEFSGLNWDRIRVPIEETEAQKIQARNNAEKKEEILRNTKEQIQKLVSNNYAFFDKRERDKFYDKIKHSTDVGQLNEIAKHVLEEKFRSRKFDEETQKRVRAKMHKTKKEKLDNYRGDVNSAINKSNIDFFDKEFISLEFLISQRLVKFGQFREFNTITQIPNPENNNSAMTIRDALGFGGTTEYGNWFFLLNLGYDETIDELINYFKNISNVNDNLYGWKQTQQKHSYNNDLFVLDIYGHLHFSYTDDSNQQQEIALVDAYKSTEEKIKQQAEEKIKELKKCIFTPKDIRHYGNEFVQKYTSDENLQKRARELVEQQYGGTISENEAKTLTAERVETLKNEALEAQKVSNSINEAAKHGMESYSKELDKEIGIGATSKKVANESLDEMNKNRGVSKDWKQTIKNISEGRWAKIRKRDESNLVRKGKLSEKKRSAIIKEIESQGTLFIVNYENLYEEIEG